MALTPGTDSIGPANGSCRVDIYREGMAQKVGDELISEVAR